MTINPYLSPAIDESAKKEAGDSPGYSQQGYIQYRRAVACLLVTLAVFFALISVSMFSQSMIGDALIASIFPMAIFVAVYQFLKKNTASQAELRRYRTASSTLRPLCFVFGPLMFVCGIVQMMWVPTQWQLFPWSFLVGGPATLVCGFLWPRMENDR